MTPGSAERLFGLALAALTLLVFWPIGSHEFVNFDSQFAIGGPVLAQLAIACSLIAQFGIYVSKGYGRVVHGAAELLRLP